MKHNEERFICKNFEVIQRDGVMKIGTDAMMLGAWAEGSKATIAKVLDIGTGTGILALMMSQRYGQAQVTAIDISEASYNLARENFENSPFAKNLVAVYASLDQYVISQPNRYDLIICNPPFFSGAAFDSPDHRITMRHTLKLSHQDLLKGVRDLMDDHGRCCFVLPYLEGLRFVELANQYGYHLEEKVEVTSFPQGKTIRLMLRFSKVTCKEPNVHGFSIYRNAPKAQYSSAYQQLTKEFYL